MFNTENQLKHDSNCLDLIRIIAALQVVFGHMVEHLMLPIDPTLFKAVSAGLQQPFFAGQT